MKFNKIPLEKQRSRRWSGGEAFDVYCYPEGSTYDAWNFDFNVSTAICEDLDSVFTKMQDTKRYLMILGGIMEITHPNRYSKCLLPFEGDAFMGDWGTISKGRCNDFNLLCRNGWDGKLEHFIMHSQDISLIKAESAMIGFFPVDASLSIKCADEIITVQPKELLWAIPEKEDEVLQLKTLDQPTNYIKINVSKPNLE